MPTRGFPRDFSFPSLGRDTRSFRLLEIVDNSTGSRHEARPRPIICKLRTFSSSSGSQTPRYSALSYTCGCPFPEHEDSSGVKDWQSPTRQIICNNQYVYVGQNLYDALEEFVRLEWFDFYWIDSLCINQRDVLERNAQVAIMGDIFQNASEVICWLGRADPHLDDVVELHRRLAMIEARFGGIKKASWSPEEIDRACRTFEIGIKGHKTTASLCKPFASFLGRRWFNRLWVAQEVGLAKRLTVLCGRFTFDWQEMVLVARHSTAAYFNIAWSFYSSSTNWSAFSLICYANIRHLQEEGVAKSTLLYKVKPGGRNEVRNACLLEVLRETAHLQASDPRDKLFGVLGLVSRASYDKKSTIRPFHVNYDLSVGEIYTLFSTALIIDLPYLSLIAWGSDNRRACEFNLPSWVPDFTIAEWCSWEFKANKYRAGIVFGQRWLREVNDKTLKVCGNLLDTISSTTTNTSCMGQLQFLLSANQTARSWQHNVIDSFCRVRFWKCDESKRISTLQKDHFQAWILLELNNLVAQGEYVLLQTFKSDLEALRSRASNGTLPSQKTIASWSTHADEVQLLNVRRLAGDMEKKARDGALAFTNRGLLARTEVAKVGDQIWIIRDAPAPIILRPVPRSTRFTLVGPAYVDGVMFGEAVNHPDCQPPVKVEIV